MTIGHSNKEASAIVFNIQRYCIHDGPGIRTTVFLKGCPLSCWWCANPESINRTPELGFVPSRCDGCGRCVPACPEAALVAGENGKPRLQRDHCTACGLCVPACLPEALAVYGKKMSASQVFTEIVKDKIFYQGSGGGVTLSGGEPLTQPSFIEKLFQMCREAGIGTAIETAGYYSPQALGRVLALTDNLMFDLKHMDPAAHEKFTGKPNDRILENARYLASSGARVLFRMPLIPGVNDTPANIRATASFLRGLGDGLNRIELLAFHRLGAGKCEAVGRENRMQGIEPPDKAHVEEIRAAFEELGTSCTISL